MKIKLDSQRLILYRKYRKMTQEQLGKAIGQSSRTIQRLENPKNEPKLSFQEIQILSNALDTWPFNLWGELPDYQEVYGNKITEAEHFARVVLHPRTFTVVFKHIPDDEEIENAMLSLEKIIEDKLKYNLENVIKVRKLFRIITSSKKEDTLSFEHFPFGTAITEFSNDQCQIDHAHWVPKVILSGYDSTKPPSKNLIEMTTDEGCKDEHPETGEVVYSNIHYGVPARLFENYILNSRSIPNINKNDEDEEVPFSEIVFNDLNLTKDVKVNN